MCRRVRAQVNVAGGDSYQDGFALYNKIGWELIHADFSETGSSNWKGPDMAECELNDLVNAIIRIQKAHAGKAVVEIVFRFFSDGVLVIRRV